MTWNAVSGTGNLLSSDYGAPLGWTKKPDRSAHTRIVVRLTFGVTEPHQAAAILTRIGHARLDVSQHR